MLLRPLDLSGTPVGIAEDGNVIHRSAAEFHGPIELRKGPVVFPFLGIGVPKSVMGERKRRLQIHDLFELLDRTIDVVMEMVNVADLGLDLEVQGIQPFRFCQLDERLGMLPFDQRKPPGIPEMRGRRTRAELERLGQPSLRCGSIPIVIHGDERADLVGIGESGVEFQRLLDSPSSMRDGFAGRQNSQA